MKSELERFEEALAMVRREFPDLAVDVNREHPHVNAIAVLPRQPGLDFEVSFNLQADELHLVVSHLWVEWFPCGKQRVFDLFMEALSGLLSGRCRVVETFVRGRFLATSKVQRPDGHGAWETFGTRYGWWALLPLRRERRILQNVRDAG